MDFYINCFTFSQTSVVLTHIIRTKGLVKGNAGLGLMLGLVAEKLGLRLGLELGFQGREAGLMRCGARDRADGTARDRRLG